MPMITAIKKHFLLYPICYKFVFEPLNKKISLKDFIKCIKNK
jgi:hypothetical protein